MPQGQVNIVECNTRVLAGISNLNAGKVLIVAEEGVEALGEVSGIAVAIHHASNHIHIVFEQVAHGHAKNENRKIRDGEVMPACVQTCPTNALYFGNLMDEQSTVRKLITDPRAYQVMGYLNIKPAVIYLKKVTQSL